jgi:serine/threonine protein phosphatase PrpC
MFTEENNKLDEENYENINKKIISTIAHKTQAGTNDYGFTKTNQDSYIICENVLNNQNYNIFGVLDGHGNYFFKYRC